MSQIGNNTGIEVPLEVVNALGAGKRAAALGGKHPLPFSAERRRESGIPGGDAIDVELTVDTAPRARRVAKIVTGRGG